MLFRDMLGEPRYEIKDRDGFCNQFPVFMAVVMKRNRLTVIRVNTRSCDDWSAKVTANVSDHLRRVTFIGHSPNIKTIFMIRIDRSFQLFKRGTDPGM